MRNNLIFAVIITLVLAGGGGFYGGMKYQQSKSPQFPSFMKGADGTARMGRTGQGGVGAGGAMRGNSFTNGQILSIEGKTLTVKTQDGSSKIVFFTDTTQIQKTDAAKAGDLANEKYVVISGTSNTDGSITATSIQLRDEPMPQPAAQNKNTQTPPATTNK